MRFREMKDADRPTDHEATEATYSGDRVRQGSIILRQNWQRVTFVAGLAAFVALVLLFVT